MVNYYSKTINETFENLQTSENGLTESEAKNRLDRYGLNELKKAKKISPLTIFFRQFANFIILILIIAVILSLLVHEYIDAAVIGAILILNEILGFIQEYKAEKAIEALKKLVSLKAIVIRAGKERKINASELVPGDIIVLETGKKIPADARIIKQVNLQTQESALTGESLPIKKTESVLNEDIPVEDRINMIFSGTIITNGRDEEIVTETRMNTEIRKIAKLIQDT